MRSLTTRLVIVISSLLIAAILAVQLYWLNTTYRYGTNEFNTSVLKVVRGVYEDIPSCITSIHRWIAWLKKGWPEFPV